ncbi:hypothetical protein [Roseomonas sp. BN140053]|uniref:hypothetical protein n=1 Tax=Roseomonas sp. BN140053 TaxID=3391898 RepID=UPI0039EB19C1
MAIEITPADREMMARFFELILVRYRTGSTTLAEAIADLSNTFVAGVASDESFRSYMRTVIEDAEQ